MEQTSGLRPQVKAFIRRYVSQNARGHARRWVLAMPGLSHLYYATDPVARTMRLHHGTEIVIDGFPRSANTYAVESFRMVNPDPSVAHHLHDQRRIRRAIKRNIPVILIVREPDGCVNSFANAITTVPVDFFYTEYAKFYEGLTDVLSKVVVADFTEVTTSWPTIIDRFNEKFGTSYRAPAADDRDEVLRRVDDFGRSHAFGQAKFDQDGFEKVVSRPSRARVDVSVAESASADVRQRALDVYARIIEGGKCSDQMPG